MKRKKMIKLLMANGIPRNKAVFYANACGAKMPHQYMAAFALVRPDLCEMLWWLWVRTRRKYRRMKVGLERHGQA